MARPLRLQFKGAIYHITARGNARQKTFLDDRDYRRFLQILAEQVGDQLWLCHAFCLMPNHYHLLLETPEANLATGMQRLNGHYSQWFNWRHEQVGHLFQGRYKSIIVDRDSHLLELCRYIVLNPVRAGITAHPGRWPWSSYAMTVGGAQPPSWLSVGWLLKQFGNNSRLARRAYHRFVMAGLNGPSPWKDLKGQLLPSTETFADRISSNLGERSPKRYHIPARKSGSPDPDRVINCVARAFGIETSEALDGSHRRAFRAAVYLLRRVVKLKVREVAELTGVTAGRISQIGKGMCGTSEGEFALSLTRGQHLTRGPDRNEKLKF